MSARTAAHTRACGKGTNARSARQQNRCTKAAIPIFLPTTKSRGGIATSCAAQEQGECAAVGRDAALACKRAPLARSSRTKGLWEAQPRTADANLEHANEFVEVAVGPRRPLAAASAPVHGLLDLRLVHACRCPTLLLCRRTMAPDSERTP